MAVKISHEPEKGNNFAFDRRLPAIRASPVNRREVRAVVGVAEEYIAARRLRFSRNRENKTRGGESDQLNETKNYT